MSKSFIIQQANTESGEYDVRESRPYPIVIQADGFKVDDLMRRMYDAEHLIGFQDGGKQVVTLLADDFAREPELAVGKCPVFVDGKGRFFALPFPVEAVTTREGN
ncbi:hypothetical protein SEA_ABBA_44 [Arthrobacter phage Abba]|uniref:Uncharacterized protein n=1 Tax=Arthrobacter phage Abba TaxID=2713256 RepID=A0A6G8R2H6_9CAUD|nr:hypothetical protein HYQ28_gp44 [Arthrobacter phage Abba]QIN94373.1 hypothetical protein SEA_ABBA_44 [Arthrobacter phage Abba]